MDGKNGGYKPETLYEAIRRRMAELETHSREPDSAALVFARRLRDPIQNVIGCASFLRDAHSVLPGETIQDCLDKICHHVDEMGVIVDELLLLAGMQPTEMESPRVEREQC